MQPCKRIVVSRVKNNCNRCVIRGEVNYTTNVGEGKSVLKRGKQFHDLLLPEIEKGVLLKPEKVKDIKSLLSAHFSTNWDERPELRFFKDVFHQQHELHEVSQPNKESVEDSDTGDILDDEETSRLKYEPHGFFPCTGVPNMSRSGHLK
ncbi:hypothetical protein J6590_031260 [Homalodisca vitripennis]|nr:hypothetical protein J6590_031260 [Homalodisca vitripennis]